MGLLFFWWLQIGEVGFIYRVRRDGYNDQYDIVYYKIVEYESCMGFWKLNDFFIYEKKWYSCEEK